MLKFLGVGSAFSTTLGNTSAYFYQENDLVLIDCGELIFKELIAKIDFEKVENIHIFLTHTHCDHVGSLGTLLSYLFIKHHKVAHLYHGGINLKEYLDLVGVSKDYYTLHQNLEPTLQDVSFKFVKTKHSDQIPCFGLEIKTPQLRIYYSGDAAIIPKKQLQDFIDGKIHRWYQDVTLIKGNSSHLSIDELESLIPRDLRRKVICMHLNEGAEPEITALGFKVANKKG